MSRIHVMGASGVGATTLGRRLAGELSVPHHDADDYYWLPTTPPFSQKRPIVDRLRLMNEMFAPRDEWVLSGSLDSWSGQLVPLFDLVVFVTAPTDIRLARLRARETLPNGDWRYPSSAEFLEWAAGYDAGTLPGRNRARHEAWLAGLPCRVLRLDGTQPLDQLVSAALAELR